jgi:ABC-type branched-subunit amino acid transport system substrate-binding protein
LARATAGFIAKELKDKKKFYLLNPDYGLGHSWAGALKKEVARQIPGSQFVGEDYHPVMSKDLSPFLTKIKMSGADVILTADWGLDMSVLLKQRRELGINAVVVGFGLAREIVNENPEAAFGAYSCNTWFPTSTSKESLDHIENWKRAYSKTDYPMPSDLTARDYIGVKFLLEGIKKAGSTEVTKLMPVLENLRVKTISGEVSMRACDHQLIMPVQCVTIDKKTPPYYSAPITIPASVTTIDEEDIDNPRCKRK